MTLWLFTCIDITIFIYELTFQETGIQLIFTKKRRNNVKMEKKFNKENFLQFLKKKYCRPFKFST